MRQRITVRCRLAPLNANETWRYLNYRLIAAGGDGRVIFTADAVESMYNLSGGIPRVLNSIADNCLLAGYSQGRPTIDADVVESVAAHLELEPASVPLSEPQTVHQDIMRASLTWNEIAHDLKSTGVPQALKAFIENLHTRSEASPVAMTRTISSGV